jgi:hypothetical protein
MTQRILGFVTIDKAVLIVAEYKEFLSRNKELLEDMMDEEEGDGENKRIKIVAKLRLEESRKQGDGRSNTMELDKDAEEEDRESQVNEEDKEGQNKREDVTKRKRRQDTNLESVEANSEEVAKKQQTQGGQPPPKNVFGSTADRYTAISASARGGNDLDDDMDEAGW